MKSFCKFAGLIATVVAFVAFILFMATPAATIDLGIGSLGKGSIKGIEGIFGGDGLSLPWAGLLAWLFVLIGFIIVALVSILPLLSLFLKVRAFTLKAPKPASDKPNNK